MQQGPAEGSSEAVGPEQKLGHEQAQPERWESSRCRLVALGPQECISRPLCRPATAAAASSARLLLRRRFAASFSSQLSPVNAAAPVEPLPCALHWTLVSCDTAAAAPAPAPCSPASTACGLLSAATPLTFLRTHGDASQTRWRRMRSALRIFLRVSAAAAAGATGSPALVACPC